MGKVDGQDSTRASKKGFGCLALARRRSKWTSKFFEGMFDFVNMAAYKLHLAMHKDTEHEISYYDALWEFHELLMTSEKWLGKKLRSGKNTVLQKKQRLKSPKAAVDLTGIDEDCPAMAGPRPGERTLTVKTVHSAAHRSSKAWPVTSPYGEVSYKGTLCCVTCARLGNGRKQTVWGCADCDDPVPLHPGECFVFYHAQIKEGKWQPYKSRTRAPTRGPLLKAKKRKMSLHPSQKKSK